MPDQMKRYADQYGPYAFGVVSLLLLWFAIFRPMLDQQNAQHLRATEIQLEAAQTVSEAVAHIDDHSAELRRLVDELVREVRLLKNR